jgi:hypothetical protein
MCRRYGSAGGLAECMTVAEPTPYLLSVSINRLFLRPFTQFLLFVFGAHAGEADVLAAQGEG